MEKKKTSSSAKKISSSSSVRAKNIKEEYETFNKKNLREAKKTYRKFIDEYGFDMLEVEHEYFAQHGNPWKPITSRDLEILTPTTILDQKVELAGRIAGEIKSLIFNATKNGDKTCSYIFLEDKSGYSSQVYDIDEIRLKIVEKINKEWAVLAVKVDSKVIEDGNVRIVKKIDFTWSREALKQKPRQPLITSTSSSSGKYSIQTSEDDNDLVELCKHTQSSSNEPSQGSTTDDYQ